MLQDLNPIENLGKLLWFKVAEHQPSSIYQLKKTIKKELHCFLLT